MISPSNNQLPLSLAISHQSFDHLIVGTQPNDQMIVNELNVPKLSLIPHDVKPVGTQPHNHDYLTDENSLNHNKPKSRQQRRMILYTKQTAGQLGLYNPSFSILTLDKKKNENASWVKLPSHKKLPRPYVLINRHNKPYLPIFMYQIHPFSSPTPVFHKLQNLIITLNKLANNRQNITTNSDMLDGIMKGIGFCQGSYSGKSAGVYARKAGLTKKKIDDDNEQWSALQEFGDLIHSRIQGFSNNALKDNQEIINAANLPNFSQLEWHSNKSPNFKTYSNVIVTLNGFHNKPHTDNNDINSWNYGIFSFINKSNFIPIPTVFTPSGHGLSFPNHKFIFDFSKKEGIVEILWKTSEILHQTTKPAKELLENESITHFGCSFQINKKLLLTGQKLKQLSSEEIKTKVNGPIM
ncbi:hypothetical protein O181_101239 [Austropuccinia psidii MF-1]|uniref:Tet-like 2OG-Fe(II) oxygenase domain-containing protein n=1 Tax=Austropuccinia psidii MF-1 TaxID=1389203 RepID=A0A9Q3JG68_9BASI|nr:hypothetical protein [Austropuccinia psidii MF-1]